MRREVLCAAAALLLWSGVSYAQSANDQSARDSLSKTGTNTITFPDPQGKVVTSQGLYVTVWRKESDGRWRCVVDFWNEAPQEQK